MDDATKQDIKRLDEINAARLKDKAEVWNALMKDCPVHPISSSFIEKSGVVRIEFEHPMARIESRFSWGSSAPFVGFYVATFEARGGVASPIHVVIRSLDPGPLCAILLCQEHRGMDGSVKLDFHQEDIELTPEDTKEERAAKIQAATFRGLVKFREKMWDQSPIAPQSDTEEPTFG